MICEILLGLRERLRHLRGEALGRSVPEVIGQPDARKKTHPVAWRRAPEISGGNALGEVGVEGRGRATRGGAG